VSPRWGVGQRLVCRRPDPRLGSYAGRCVGAGPGGENLSLAGAGGLGPVDGGAGVGSQLGPT